MPVTVEAEIGARAGIVATEAPHTVFNGLLVLRLTRDHGAEEQAADDAGGGGAIVATAATTAAMTWTATTTWRTPALHLND